MLGCCFGLGGSFGGEVQSGGSAGQGGAGGGGASVANVKHQGWLGKGGGHGLFNLPCQDGCYENTEGDS